jgi:hypothetical protein
VTPTKRPTIELRCGHESGCGNVLVVLTRESGSWWSEFVGTVVMPVRPRGTRSGIRFERARWTPPRPKSKPYEHGPDYPEQLAARSDDCEEFGYQCRDHGWRFAFPSDLRGPVREAVRKGSPSVRFVLEPVPGGL